MKEEAASARGYGAVYAALVALTAATVGAAFLDLGPLNFVVALAIASLKAGLVAFHFMHLKDAGPRIRLFAAAGFLWLFILYGLTESDYLTRRWLPVAETERPNGGGR